MRKQSYTYREIAQRLGVPVASAYRYVNDHWQEISDATDEVAELVRDLELEKLDRLERILSPKVDADNMDVSLRIVDRLLRIQERRAKLLGLEAPQKRDVLAGHKLDPAEVLAAVREFSPALYRGNGTS